VAFVPIYIPIANVFKEKNVHLKNKKGIAPIFSAGGFIKTKKLILIR